MLFVVIAEDYSDEDALSRRLACREEHIALIDTYKAQGHFMLGGAFLNDAGHMVGSMLVCDFPSRQALDQWLEQEPYILNRVWEKMTVRPYALGPSFQVQNTPLLPSSC